jgi:hypothetical protein
MSVSFLFFSYTSFQSLAAMALWPQRPPAAPPRHTQDSATVQNSAAAQDMPKTEQVEVPETGPHSVAQVRQTRRAMPARGMPATGREP